MPDHRNKTWRVKRQYSSSCRKSNWYTVLFWHWKIEKWIQIQIFLNMYTFSNEKNTSPLSMVHFHFLQWLKHMALCSSHSFLSHLPWNQYLGWRLIMSFEPRVLNFLNRPPQLLRLTNILTFWISLCDIRCFHSKISNLVTLSDSNFHLSPFPFPRTISPNLSPTKTCKSKPLLNNPVH